MAKINFGGTVEDVVTRDEFSLDKAREVLKNEVVAVLGYGVQGPAQAMNMRDNGIKVIDSALGGHCNSYYAKQGLGIFDKVPFENPHTWSFRHIWPKTALIGMQPAQHGDILSGGYMNLFNKQVVTTAQFKVGKGRLIVTTMNLLEHVAMEPAATLVFNGMIEYAAGDFKPTTELKLTAPQ